MRKIKAIAISAAILIFAAAPAAAQFKFGPKLGVEVNKMSLSSDILNNENRAGFTGGLMLEFTVPVINLGFDLSAMYVHRVTQTKYTPMVGTTANDNEKLVTSSRFKNRDYIEIPLNLKYKIAIPAVGKIITPYIFTGPSFAFLTSKKAINEAYKNKKFDIAWNFGLGLQLFDHLQVGASYGIGISKTVEYIAKNINTAPIDGKNKYWTVTAAWLF